MACYLSETFVGNSASKMLSTIMRLGISEFFSEVLKLCKLILTIPATSASVKRSLSALKRIKSSTKNKMEEGRLSNLTLLSVEKKNT